MSIVVVDTLLQGVKVVEPKVYGDERGFFLETFQVERYKSLLGIESAFVQDNHSRSRKGVLRGLHFQINKPQGKLVRCTVGSVFDVVVDINVASPTYGQYFGVVLSAENYRQLWVPPGFAHGFFVSSEVAEIQYKCTDYYDPDDEGGIAWDDPAVGIDWPLSGDQPLLSEKDLMWPKLEGIKD